MLSYEEFKEYVKENILGYMPEKFHDFTVKFEKITKVNVEVESLALLPNDGEGTKIVPTLNVIAVYQDYQERLDLELIIKETAETLEEAFEHPPISKKALDFENMKEKIFLTLVNTEKNQELLNNAPNRPFKDLSIVYRFLVSEDENSIASGIVSNNLMRTLNMTEEELYALAYENTPKISPFKIKLMEDQMRDILQKYVNDGQISEEELEEFFSIAPSIPVYVVSNFSGINGSVAMIYEPFLYETATKLDSNLFVLPCSIHEVLLVPENEELRSLEEMKELVTSVNASDSMELSEILSDNAYYYDKEKRKLLTVNDIPGTSSKLMTEENIWL